MSTNDEVRFTRGAARRPQADIQGGLLQWATGLPTRERTIYAGWFVEANKDADMDQAMRDAGIRLLTIKHGSGNHVEHWALADAPLFVIAGGAQGMGEMKRTTERYGVAFGWRVLEGGRSQSWLQARVLPYPLLMVGYAEPLLLTVKSTLTGDILGALAEQYRVLDAITAIRVEAKLPPMELPFYASALPIGAGEEVSRGSGATRSIFPPVSLIPEVIDREYVRQHWIKPRWVEVIEDLLDETVRWSIERSSLSDEDAGEYS